MAPIDRQTVARKQKVQTVTIIENQFLKCPNCEGVKVLPTGRLDHQPDANLWIEFECSDCGQLSKLAMVRIQFGTHLGWSR